MKKLFPVAIIIICCLLSFGSCKKKSSTTTCTCKSKGDLMQDTTVSFTKVDSVFTSVSQECSELDTFIKDTYGSGYGCHL